MASDSEWVPSDSNSSSLEDDVELEDELYEGLPRQYTSKLPVSAKKPPEPQYEVAERPDEPHDIPLEPQDEMPTEQQVEGLAEPQDIDLLPELQDEMLVDDPQEHFPEEIPQLESPQKRGRKKLRKENEWLKNKRKKLRNEGKSYLSSRKKVVPEKIFAAVDCSCRMGCLQKFDDPKVLEDFFNTFWKLGDYSKQNAFLRGMVGKKVPLRVRPRDNSSTPKSTLFQYFIPTGKEDIKVCKKFFLSVLKISWGRLYKCLTAQEAFGVLDGRGKGKPINKIDDSDVVAHIKSFPAYQSHYTRKDNINKKYLNSDLNVRKMYDLYVKKCSEEHKEPVKLKYYYHVFSTKFNLHFKPPAKDTCKDCDALQIQINAETDEAKRQDLLTTKENHLVLAETAREELSNDKAAASHDTYVCTYDLQKALPFPKLSTSVAYYKRNMYMYNFGVHSFNDSTAHMYVYDETEGGRGAEDISSCLTKHLRENAKEHKNIVLFSDSCGGQNRNIKTSLTMLKLVQDPAIKAEKIDLKYMVPGHSFLPNDTDFGMIERASQKNHQIWEPQTWIDIIKTSKRKEPHFEVHPMSRDEFLSTKVLEEAITNRKKATDGEIVNWLKIRWMRFERSKPFEIQFKHSFKKDAPFRTINLKQVEGNKKRKNAKPQKGLKLKSLFEVKQVPLYLNRRAITVAKKNDMLSLLQFIPGRHHGYFKNLPVDVATRSQRPADINEEDDDNDEVIYE